MIQYRQSHFGLFSDFSRRSLLLWLQEMVSINSEKTPKKNSSQSHISLRSSPPSFPWYINSPLVNRLSNQKSGQKNSRSETQQQQQHPRHRDKTETWQPQNGVRIRRPYHQDMDEENNNNNHSQDTSLNPHHSTISPFLPSSVSLGHQIKTPSTLIISIPKRLCMTQQTCRTPAPSVLSTCI